MLRDLSVSVVDTKTALCFSILSNRALFILSIMPETRICLVSLRKNIRIIQIIPSFLQK